MRKNNVKQYSLSNNKSLKEFNFFFNKDYEKD